jgi:hypothetical protein
MAPFILLEKQPPAEFLELEVGTGYISLERSGQFLLEQYPWHLTLETAFFELG